jgi:uncharacterized glyoxalase superfamily protein PhnB
MRIDRVVVGTKGPAGFTSFLLVLIARLYAIVSAEWILKIDMSGTFKPKGWPTVIPRIFTRDETGLVDFLRTCFGASGELVAGRPAEMRIGDSMLLVSTDEFRLGTRAVLYIYVADAEATYAATIAAGAVSIEAPVDMPYGDRRAMIEDPWGNTWQIATRLAE